MLPNHEDSDGLAPLSSLDVITCGFGGSILLGIVFMLIRDEVGVEASAPPFIRASWTVEDAPSPSAGQDAPIPLLNVRVRPPDARAFDLPLEDFDWTTGRPKPVAERSSKTLPIDSMRLVGISRLGDADVRTIRDGEGRLPRPPRVFRLDIDSPGSGTWTLQARYQSILNGDELPAGLDLSGHRATVSTRVTTRDEYLTPEDVHIRLGRLTEPIMLFIP